MTGPRGTGSRWLVVVLAGLVVVVPWLWLRVAGDLWAVLNGAPAPAGQLEELRRLVVADLVRAVVAGLVLAAACFGCTRRSLRLRTIGSVMGLAAAVAALEAGLRDWAVLELLDGSSSAAGDLRMWAGAVHDGLFFASAAFALGVLVAWAGGSTDRRPTADPAKVADALRWAGAQPRDLGPAGPAHHRLRAWWRAERHEPRVPPPGAARPDPRSPDKLGICFSGGGIRSASFNLGVIQQLQAAGELQRAGVLSAVSGGSYMAAGWALCAAHSPAVDAGAQAPFAPGSPEEQYLRNRTTYLVPGALGAAVALWRYLRSLAFNVALIAAVLFVASRPYGWLVEERLDRSGDRVSFDAWPGAVEVVIALAFVALALGLVSFVVRLRQEQARRTEAWSARLAAAGLVAVLLVLVLPRVGAWFLSQPELGGIRVGDLANVASGVGVAFSVIGGLVAIRRKGPDEMSVGAGLGMVGKMRTKARAVGRGVERLFLVVVGAVVGPLTLAVGGFAIALGAMVSPGFRPGELTLWLTVASLLALVQGISDANRWSLQPYYKERLQSAFVLRRTDAGRAEAIAYDQPLPFSDLLGVPPLVVCAAANLGDYGLLPPGRGVSTFTFSGREVDAGILGSVPAVHFEVLLGEQFRGDFTVPAAMAASGAAFSPVMGKMTRFHLRFLFALANLRLGVWLPNPRHVVRWAQDQIGARDQGAGGDGPGEVGAERLAREARDHWDAYLQAQVDEALAEDQVRTVRGAVLAGAAPSGDLTAARLRLLAAQLRASRAERDLREAGQRDQGDGHSSQFAYPHLPRPHLIFSELLGIYRARSRFVYVTDGGHYENLGLVELLRRGCRWIYCFDAAGDSTDAFTTLADAVSIARTELGVEVYIDPQPLAPQDGSDISERLVVTGRARYPGGGTADIVFAKLGVAPGLPLDVASWHRSHPSFPTDGTADQLYTDQRFEAYRALGSFAALDAIAQMRELRGERDPVDPAPLR